MKILVLKDVPLRMRDGVELATDIYRSDCGKAFPTLVQRTPYDKDSLSQTNFALDINRGVRSGYAIVVQDTRGRFGSSGEFCPFATEADDGVDTIEWVARQPWSSGRVGMIGGSYVGAVQWLAASRNPSALGAIAPMVASTDGYGGWLYPGGAFALGAALCWVLQSLVPEEIRRRSPNGRGTERHLETVVRCMDTIDTLHWQLPSGVRSLLKDATPFYFQWLTHPRYDDYWEVMSSAFALEQVNTPALHIGGWYDHFLSGTLSGYRSLRDLNGVGAANMNQRLIVGPWSHGVYEGAFPERQYGTAAGVSGLDLTGHQLRWFDHWLKGQDNGASRTRPVQIFVMGADAWREEDDWPLPDTSFTPYYLRSGGRAISAAGDGRLDLEPPKDEPEDIYHYDPHNPVPTVGGATLLPYAQVGANAGPRDQRVVEGRNDVLCYSSSPLQTQVEVTGPVRLILYACSNALDTDFTGKLVDVWPDGRAEILTDGILRARYRDSFSEPQLLEPGRVYELEIDLAATANVFKEGHRIRLEISSSNFPRFDRNTNTGGTIHEEDARTFVVATNRIFHDSKRPSHLLLPIISRDWGPL